MAIPFISHKIELTKSYIRLRFQKMRIPLQEIWNFLTLVGEEALEWEYALQAGGYEVEGIQGQTIEGLRKDVSYDTELLPSLFTFREILWQPDVFVEAQKSITPLRILRAHCEELIEGYHETDAMQNVYKRLIQGISNCSESAEKAIEEDQQSVTDVLSGFRLCTFPIIKFFIYHPMNRRDYHMDAINRLNYAVRIMLTQFYGQYSELSEPVWMVKKNNIKREI